jgi:cytochrome c
LLAILAAAPALAQGDATRGEAAYRQCVACHALVPESRPAGPSLMGVMGRAAGTREDFRYSPAMARSGIVWDAASMDAYLASPATAVRGGRMAFAGVRDGATRADIIAYLATLR